MKTSNIILLGFLLTIFAIPLLLIASLNSKVKNKEFTLVKNNYEPYVPMIREGSIKDFSVIKIEGPDPDYLECHLKQSDFPGYRYEKQDTQDSINVYTSNDTLYVHYLSLKDSTGKREIRLGNKIEFELKIKSLSNIVIDAADVMIDSLDTKDGFKLILKNNGRIKDVKHVYGGPSSSIDPAKVPSTNKNIVAELEPETQIMEAVESLRSSMDHEIKDMLIFHLM